MSETVVGGAVSKLTSYMPDASGFDILHEDIRELQLEAMNERLQDRIDRIKLVNLRAQDAGITEIRRLEDVVPLLLPHTAYKSYPESFLTEKKWDRLTKWLGTVSAYPTDNVDLSEVREIDDWVEACAKAGHFVACSSGTTGKSAMLVATKGDVELSCDDAVKAFAWCTGIAPSADRRVFQLAPIIRSARNVGIGAAMARAYGKPGAPEFDFPVPPITIGSITRMVALRKAITEGTARPSELIEYEETSAQRQQAVDESIGRCADALIEARAEPLVIVGLWATLYQIAEQVRSRGYSGEDFQPGNTSYIAGGLKGAKVPANYKEFIYGTFNMDPDRNFQMYGMQEINCAMPRCREANRYHIPPWMICLPLDKSGDRLVPMGEGEIEGRAAFFDLSLEGRWGGVISGDHIHVDYGTCACGNRSPSIRDDIYRYSDLEGDDKIGCAGTVDAYVRGLS